jgi:hypothetical protein
VARVVSSRCSISSPKPSRACSTPSPAPRAARPPSRPPSRAAREGQRRRHAGGNQPLEDDEDKDGPVPGKHYELNRSNNHAVLEIKDADGKVVGVCDPYQRDKGQVVTNQEELDDYGKAHEAR